MNAQPRARLGARAWAGVAGLICLSLAIGTGMPGRSATAVAPRGGDSSQVTVSGTGAFSTLKVTVGQTKHLVNQAVNVSWTGARPTPGSNVSTFPAHFLHLMQCWGDDPAGPTREQCEFGVTPFLSTAQFINQRRLATKTTPLIDGITDPAETTPDAAAGSPTELPFQSVTGKTVSGLQNLTEFFDQNVTNEAIGRTQADGTGQVPFETQTARESHGLGCGAPLADAAGAIVGRKCWLVIVPRDDHEVDGSLRPGGSSNSAGNWLVTSALQATNWAARIVVPLEFEPLGGVCALGSSERPTLGSAVIEDAVLRWQPPLCSSGGSVFSYSDTAELTARRKLLTKSPGLTFFQRPVPADQVPVGREPSYAPVALSGIGIAFNIDIIPRSAVGNPTPVPPAVLAKAGTPVDDLFLTPRLVAKLLTQSYLSGAQNAPHVAGNPPNLTADPEFQRLNPDFADLSYTGSLGDIMVPTGLSDIAGQVWEWIGADQQAAAWLAGAPDEYGMKVNPYYAGTSTGRDDFPKDDPYCLHPQGSADHCTLDAFPYANDMHAGVRDAARGAALSRNVSVGADTTNNLPPRWLRDPRIGPGGRALLAFTDTVTAHRYGLPMAHLRNASGAFIAPTNVSLIAGLDGMKPSGVAGVLSPDPLLGVGNAYPLPTLTYAATDTTQLTSDAAQDYSRFLRYAVAAGQRPGEGSGELPAGYVPLPQRFVDQTLDLADRLVRPAVTTSPTPQPTATVTRTASPAAAASVTNSPLVASTSPPAFSVATSAVPAAALVTTPPRPSLTVAPSGSAPATVLPTVLPPTNVPPTDARPTNQLPTNLPTTNVPTTKWPRQITAPFPAPIRQLSRGPAVAALAKPPATAPPAPPTIASAPISATAGAPVTETTPLAAVTPRVPLGPERYALLLLLVLGAVAGLTAGFGPMLSTAAPIAGKSLSKVRTAGYGAMRNSRAASTSALARLRARRLPK